MKYAFIIVTYNTPEVYVQNLKDQIAQFGIVDYKIYVVDNSQTKKGYAEGINEGIQLAQKDGCSVFVCMNPDISFQKVLDTEEPGLIANVMKHLLEKFDVAGFGFEQNGEIYYGGKLNTIHLSGGLETEQPSQRYAACDFVSGSCMIISQKAYEKLGGLDTSYGMYYEDTDYGVRARKIGLRLGIDSEVVYEHFETSRSNPQKQYMLERARLMFLAKHGSAKQKLYEVIRSPKTIWQSRTIILQFLKQAKTFSNFMSMNIASMLQKGFFFLLFLALTRVLSPEEYGTYSVVWAHIGVFAPFLDMGTTSYGVVYGSSEKNHLKDLVSFRFYAACAVFIASLLVAGVGVYSGELLQYIALASVIFFANAFSGTYLILTTLKGRSYHASLASAVFAAFYVAFVTGMLFTSQNMSAVFIAVFVGYAVYAGVNVGLIRRLNPNLLSIRIRLPVWQSIVKRSFTFVLIGIFAGLYYRIDIFLLHALKGDGAVGLYSAGYKFYDAGMFIVASYNIVATPVLAKAFAESYQNFIRRIKHDVWWVLIGGIGMSALYYITSPLLISLLRPEYISVVPVIRILGAGFPFLLLASVFINALYVSGRAKWVLGIFAMQILFNAGFNYVFIPQYSYVASAWGTVLSEVLNGVVLGILLVLTHRGRVKV